MIRFFLLTGKEFASLEAPDPEAIYFIRDEHRIQTAGVDFCSGVSGFGQIAGGYAAAVSAYSNTGDAVTVTLQALSSEETDMTKFLPGANIWFNVCNEADEATEELLFQKRTILSVDADRATLTLDAPLENANVNEIVPEKLFCMVPDSTRRDNASATGDKNFVTGARSHANGSWNTVTGLCSTVSAGAQNLVTGDFSEAIGIDNHVSGTLSLAVGGNNEVCELSSLAVGTGNRAMSQDERILGSTNNVSAVNSTVIGNVNTVTGYGTTVIGGRNTAGGKGGISIGNGLENHADHAVMIGNYGSLDAGLENTNALAIAAGSRENPENIMVFRSRRPEKNPNYEDGSETETPYVAVPAYRTTFRGQLSPVTGELSADAAGNAVIDAALYSRWRVSGEGSVHISMVNAVDGDRIELVLDSASLTPVFPDTWIGSADVTSRPGVYLLEIVQVGENVFYGIRFPR